MRMEKNTIIPRFPYFKVSIRFGKQDFTHESPNIHFGTLDILSKYPKELRKSIFV